MKTFIYKGPEPNSISLRGHGDVILTDNATIDLPEDNEHVKTLIAKGFLVEAPEIIKKTKFKKETI
jgi:hypothetical protein